MASKVSIQPAKPGDLESVVRLCAERAAHERAPFSPEGKRERRTQPFLQAFRVFGASVRKLIVRSSVMQPARAIFWPGRPLTICTWIASSWTLCSERQELDPNDASNRDNCQGTGLRGSTERKAAFLLGTLSQGLMSA
jgi:hypothetical protein